MVRFKAVLENKILAKLVAIVCTMIFNENSLDRQLLDQHGTISAYLYIDPLVLTDIDECEEIPEICDQDCHNTEGSFYCSCRDGFVLGHDGECEEGTIRTS